MTGNILLATLEKLLTAAGEKRIKVVLMGGLATSVYSPPRATFDIDCISDIKEGAITDFLEALGNLGFAYDKANPVKRIHGLPFVTLSYSRYKVYVDIFLAASDFQNQIVNRSRPVKINNLRLNIISPEDLILVKLLSGRSKDTEDTRQILIENADRLDFTYLSRWSGDLGVKVFLEDEMESLGIKPPRTDRPTGESDKGGGA